MNVSKTRDLPAPLDSAFFSDEIVMALEETKIEFTVSRETCPAVGLRGTSHVSGRIAPACRPLDKAQWQAHTNDQCQPVDQEPHRGRLEAASKRCMIHATLGSTRRPPHAGVD
jgi:hypothetical protein